MVDIYEVMWQRDTSGDCPDQDVGSTTLNDGSTSLIVTGLEESINYTITVIATNANVMEISNSVAGFTQESGAIMSLLDLHNIIIMLMCIHLLRAFFISSVYCSNLCECI